MTVKDQIFELNTGQMGYDTVTTPKITGCLKGILIDASEQVELAVTIEDMDGVIIFYTGHDGIYGQHYISPRKMSHTEDNKKLNSDASYWVLNDKLVIEILGSFDISVKVKLRWEYD